LIEWASREGIKYEHRVNDVPVGEGVLSKIENGMTLEQVNGLLARQGRLSSSSGNVEIYSWSQGFTNADVTIYVTFTDGSVTGKEWSSVPR
jgi:hypothetical protein